MLSDREIAQLRALAARGAAPADAVERLVLDVVEMRMQLRRQLERMRLEQERLLDLLDRVRGSFVTRDVRRIDDELDALVAEIDDALHVRLRPPSLRR